MVLNYEVFTSKHCYPERLKLQIILETIILRNDENYKLTRDTVERANKNRVYTKINMNLM